MPSAMLLSNEIDDNVGYTRSVCKELFSAFHQIVYTTGGERVFVHYNWLLQPGSLSCCLIIFNN